MSDFGSIFKAGGKLYGGLKDAKALRRQAKTAYAQGYADEAAARRSAKYQLGEQAAALAQAGLGPGGTAELVVKDSAIAAEMDALNYRYRGLQQGRALRSQAKAAKRDAFLSAGAELLGGYGDNKNTSSMLKFAGG